MRRNVPYHFFIAFRYLKSRKRHKGISLNTVISVGGVAVGVMALLVVLSVMSGFHEDLQRKILGVNAHIIVLSYRGAMTDYKEVLEKVSGEKMSSLHRPLFSDRSCLHQAKGRMAYL